MSASPAFAAARSAPRRSSPATRTTPRPTWTSCSRCSASSLAPTPRWGFDHRGAMVRVLGGKGDPATRLENRVGEPAANPYLYIASQIVAGLDGIERKLEPGPRDDEPYAADRPLLPASLGEALAALDKSTLFRHQLGDVFVDYYLKLKGSELGRYRQWLEGSRVAESEPTEWEQNEYFDFF